MRRTTSQRASTASSRAASACRANGRTSAKRSSARIGRPGSAAWKKGRSSASAANQPGPPSAGRR
ncbi:hypothetical protein ACFQ9X_24670 [Catenulispora yoronensis]